jgi:DNA repair exonuclease SbcCD ATPase subunit
MKQENDKKRIADMDVLKDIKGLLLTAKQEQDSMQADMREETELKIEIDRCKEELQKYRLLAGERQEELEKLRKENEEMLADLNSLSHVKKEVPISTNSSVEGLKLEIAQLEARKCELSSALSEVEVLLQLRLKDLLRRIARVYEEIGEGEIVLEFRKAADSLQAADNFAYFLRALLNE